MCKCPSIEWDAFGGIAGLGIGLTSIFQVSLVMYWAYLVNMAGRGSVLTLQGTLWGQTQPTLKTLQWTVDIKAICWHLDHFRLPVHINASLLTFSIAIKISHICSVIDVW